MGDDIDGGGEKHGQQGRPEVAEKAGAAAEHHKVNLHREDQPCVEILAEETAEGNAHQRQNDVFTADVRRDLQIVEAQHLQRRHFSRALGNVDIGKIGRMISEYVL